MSSSTLLEVSNLTKEFPIEGFIRRRYLRAVDNVSFEISGDEATITTLAGESGSGKTTISRLILGLITPTSGEIKYKGRSVQELLKRRPLYYRKEVQAIFQDPYSSYNPFYKVDRTFESVIKKFKLASSSSEIQRIIEESIEAVGLRGEDVLGKYPHQLSGGQAQRVLVARALMLKPNLLIADEPVSMIDASLRAGILNLLTNLGKTHGMSILFITHDLSVAYHLTDNIIILYRGGIMEMGDVGKVIDKGLHPYVHLLVNSVPLPDPNRRWEGKTTLDADIETEKSVERASCLFYDRCPYDSDECTGDRPSLTAVEKNHWVACHKIRQFGSLK